MQTLLAVLVVMGLCKTGKEYAAVPFMVSVITMMPIATGMSLQLSDIYYITVLGSLWLIKRYRKKQENVNARKMLIKQEHLVFLILGMLTSYFDFLTYPFVSLGIPLVVSIMYTDREEWLKRVVLMTKNSGAWCVGYLGMWAGKWILGSILLPESGSLDMAIKSIKYRGSNVAGGMTITVIDVVLKNLFVYLRRPTILLIVISGIYFIYKIVKKKYWLKNQLLSCIPYFFICLYPAAWYFIAQNHSFEHAFMTYRELAITTFAGLVLLAEVGHKNSC